MIIITGYSSEVGKSTFNLLKKYNNFIFSGRFKPKFIRKTDIWLKVDLSSTTSVNKYLKQLNKQTEITGLIYIAAFQSERKTLVDHSIEEIENSISVNFKSPLLIIQSLIKKKLKNFNIVLVGSEAAVYGGNNISVYAMTKSALHSFPRSLSKEIGRRKIRINLISPSTIKTKKLLKMTKNIKEIEKSIALGRVGESKEVANLIKWLMSEKSSYITGTIIPISGGR